MENWLWISIFIFEENLATPSVLTRTYLREILYLYLAFAEEVVNIVLIRDFYANHNPVYFISKALVGGKNAVPKDWKDNLSVSDIITQDTSILPRAFHSISNGFTSKVDVIPIGLGWASEEVGHSIFWIWSILRCKKSFESPIVCRLLGRDDLYVPRARPHISGIHGRSV